MINISDLIGKPFANGGRGPEVFDCYGLVRETYHRLGIELPELFIDCFDIEKINNEYQLQSKHLIRLDKPELYCIVAMRNSSPFVNHFGVYLGNHEFIHALDGSGTCITSTDHIYWKRTIAGYCQWCPDKG
jgi:Cell wall-associated hydrolases (invasion-associated proteins)